MRSGAAIAAAVLATATGCGAEAAAPPSRAPTITVPRVRDVSPAVAAAAQVTLPVLERDTAHRAAEKLTVRVRNVTPT